MFHRREHLKIITTLALRYTELTMASSNVQTFLSNNKTFQQSFKDGDKVGSRLRQSCLHSFTGADLYTARLSHTQRLVSKSAPLKISQFFRELQESTCRNKLRCNPINPTSQGLQITTVQIKSSAWQPWLQKAPPARKVAIVTCMDARYVQSADNLTTWEFSAFDVCTQLSSLPLWALKLELLESQ